VPWTHGQALVEQGAPGELVPAALVTELGHAYEARQRLLELKVETLERRLAARVRDLDGEAAKIEQLQGQIGATGGEF
jgi:hypothetical protein